MSLAIAGDDDAPEPAPPTFGSRLFAAVRVLATLAILAGLVVKLSPGEIRQTIADADPWLIAAAFALMCVVQALVLIKWATLLRVRDVTLAGQRMVRAYCVGNLLSTVLPTAIGGDVYRVYRVQRESSARAADVTMTILYERATGYAAMTCLGALGAAFHYGNASIGLLAVAGGAAAAGLIALLLPRMPLPALPPTHFLRNLLADRRELIAVYQMTLFSLIIQALYISTIALCGRAFGAHISWWYWAFATWIVAMAILLPITIGGLGVRESGYSGLVRHAGGTAAQGASTGFALGVLLVATNILLLAAVEVLDRIGYARPARVELPAR